MNRPVGKDGLPGSFKHDASPPASLDIFHLPLGCQTGQKRIKQKTVFKTGQERSMTF